MSVTQIGSVKHIYIETDWQLTVCYTDFERATFFSKTKQKNFYKTFSIAFKRVKIQ